MTVRRVCPGVRLKPLDHMSGGPQAKGNLKRYGQSKCQVCRGWYVAHKDGTPVYHKVKP